MEFHRGHVKRDPETGTVAVRTQFPDQAPFSDQTWLTATTNIGAHSRSTAFVESWDDLYVAPPPAEPQPGA